MNYNNIILYESMGWLFYSLIECFGWILLIYFEFFYVIGVLVVFILRVYCYYYSVFNILCSSIRYICLEIFYFLSWLLNLYHLYPSFSVEIHVGGKFSEGPLIKYYRETCIPCYWLNREVINYLDIVNKCKELGYGEPAKIGYYKPRDD